MDRLTPHTLETLAELKRLASLPLGETLTSPPALYNSEEIHALELERIFAKDWLCPGLAAEIPKAGDYLTFSIGAQPIVSLRQKDGTIRTFSNICRHRLMILLSGRGSVQRIICPYHAWTYDLGGGLVGAPQMQQTANFDRSKICLPEIRTEIWNGWIYVTLNPSAPSVAETLAPLHALVERFDMAGYVPIIHQDFTWQTNWKMLNENFMEGYHGPYAHKSTAGQGFKVEDTRFDARTYDGFAYHTFVRDETANFGRAHPANTRLEGIWRSTSVLPTVYPSHMYSLAPDYLWYLSLRPEGVGAVQVRLGIAIPPEIHGSIDDLSAYKATMEEFFDKVNGEDKVIVEGIYRGSRAPLAQSAPTSWLERALHDFKGYLARRLAA